MKTFLKGSDQTYIASLTPIDDFVTAFISTCIYNNIARLLWNDVVKSTVTSIRDACHEESHAPVWDSVNDSIFMSVHRYMSNYEP